MPMDGQSSAAALRQRPRRSGSPHAASGIRRPAEKRTSKACDVCRMRRTKCTGSLPCTACVTNGTEAECNYRRLARPNRKKPYLHNEDGAAARGSTINPIAIIEAEVASFQEAASGLSLPECSWMERRSWQPLTNRQTMVPLSEEALIVHFFQTFHEHFHYLDATELLDIHARWRLAPMSVSGDLVALLRACLCAASSSFGASADRVSAIGEVDETRSKSAFLYYRLAWDDIKVWNKPSIPALWALHLLIGYSMGEGTCKDTRPLVEQMCNWAIQMRLDHKDTARLYPDGDGVHQLFLSCFYFDCLVAEITGGPPSLSWGTFEIDMSFVGSHPATTIQVAVFESELLSMFAGGKHPTLEEALELETKWNPHMRTIRMLSNTINVEENALAYANIRFSWLLIMLRASFLKHPSFAANSLATMARAAGHILWIYHRLASVARYQPSWPQLRRIVTCGQILILSWTMGDAQYAETKALFEMFQRLLRVHNDKWPVSRELDIAFKEVATLNGWAPVSLPSENTEPVLDQNTWEEWFSVLAGDLASG